MLALKFHFFFNVVTRLDILESRYGFFVLHEHHRPRQPVPSYRGKDNRYAKSVCLLLIAVVAFIIPDTTQSRYYSVLKVPNVAVGLRSRVSVCLLDCQWESV